ncbi:MAG TPA: helix-turn-helix domain-containing protein, partial [Ktedonobacteraceae bacterium]
DGEVCSREDMVFAVYQCEYQGRIDDGRIDAMVERARKKIEEDPSSPRFLKTVHRRGHLLEGYNGNAR